MRCCVAVANSHRHDREEAIFREGYQRGFAEALTKADEGVERQTRAAFALAALDDEIERKKSLEGDLARLQSSRYKYVMCLPSSPRAFHACNGPSPSFRAPLRALQCQKEELELSACDVDARSTDCRRAISSYAACADRLVQDIMLPLAKSQLK